MVNDWRNAEEVVNVGASIFSQLGNPELECYFSLSSSMVRFNTIIDYMF